MKNQRTQRKIGSAAAASVALTLGLVGGAYAQAGG